MTITPAETELRISRLENDVDALYDLLKDIGKVQAQHSRQLDTVNAKLDSLTTTQVEHGNRLDTIDTRLDAIETTQVEHGNRLDAIETRLDTMDAKLETIIAMLGERGS